jgi:hypothetical protein
MSKQVNLFLFGGGAMNKPIPASHATPFLLEANKCQTPNAGFPGDFQDLCSFAMDQALAMEKASQATVVSFNSCMLDIFGNSLEMTAKSFAFCMELQINWLNMFSPYAFSHVAAVGDTVTTNYGKQDEPRAEALAHDMDIAIGEFAVPESNSVTTISGSTRESSMDMAMSARA